MLTFLGIIISTLTLTVSWFVNANLNRKHEISKRLLDLRVETFFELQKVFDMLSGVKDKKEMNSLLEKCKYNLRACGYDSELEMWGNLIRHMEGLKKDINNKELNSAANTTFHKAQELFIGNLRKELGLKPFKLFFPIDKTGNYS